MTERVKPFQVGLIGCGRVAETLHLPALQHLQGVEVVAVADLDPDRLQRVADRFHIPHRHTDVLALLANPAIEAVAVCVPAEFHVEVALAALEAGKHVFIEKPLALSLDDSDRLMLRAAQSTRQVMIGFNLRWHRLLRQARDIVQQGTLGPLVLIRTVLTGHHQDIPEWRKRRARGGGVLFEIAVHHFDLWRFLLQSEIEEVFATSRSVRWEDETATVTAHMANGALAASVFSESTGASHEVEIYGQAGRLQVSCHRFDGLECLPAASFQGDVWTRLGRMAHVLQELPQAVLRARQGGDLAATYRAEWRHFIDAIHQDTPVACTLEDGRRALQVVLAAAESAALGQAVKVAQAPRSITPTAAALAVNSGDAESAA